MSFDAQNCVLGLFAKWPEPGLVKSRLATETSPEWAARVARAFLVDLVTRFTTLPVRRVVVFTPPETGSNFAELVHGRFELVPQSAGDLGERLCAFLREEFQRGAERVVLIGADSPTLPAEFVAEAFSRLDNTDVVIGPATDGGYYLIGCTRFVPELFAGIRWSSDRVLLDTIERVREMDLRISVLPPWYDVDTLSDWRMLRGHLEALRLSGAAISLPHIEEIIDSEAAGQAKRYY